MLVEFLILHFFINKFSQVFRNASPKCKHRQSNRRNTKKKTEKKNKAKQKQTNKNRTMQFDVNLVSLLLTLNKFDSFFCFYC